MTNYSKMLQLLPAAAAVAMFSMLSAGSASAQQFDCRDAHKKAEKAICNSGKLSVLDDRMNEAYDDLMNSYGSKHKRNGLRRHQRDFLEARNSCRGDKDCIKGAYLDRISELEDRLDRRARRSER